MAKYIPTKETLEWFENRMRNDPDMSHALDNWEHLPVPPCFEDPEYYLPTISRKHWGALPAKPGATALTNPIMYIRYTWVGKEDCLTVEECSRFVREFQKTCMDQGMPDIQFNFLIGGKGVLYEGRGWEWEADREERHHNFEGLFGKLRGQTIDVAYIGDMSFYGPTNEMMMAAHNFIQRGVRQGYIHEMFEPIPYRERPTDYLSSEAFFDESNMPASVVKQIEDARRNDPDFQVRVEPEQPPGEY